MTRVRGFCNEYDIKDRPEKALVGDFEPVYVEAIPSDAVRCEAKVKKMWFSERIGILVALPEHLIGRKVSVIIIPLEEEI